MLRAFSTAATGMSAQQTMVDVTANNLANINTNGFKRSQIDFQDLLYVRLREFGSEVGPGVTSPSGTEVGSGVKVAGTVKVFTGGELVNTNRDLDVAIAGEGFLQVSMQDGTKRYTRDGSLQKGPDGELMTSGGYLIEPAITIPTAAIGLSISKNGIVNVRDENGDLSAVGTLQLARFSNQSGLASEGDNLLSETDASGTPTLGSPGDSGYGTIQSGFLEKSNVQMVTELVNLITAQRAYEVCSRTIKAGDDMLRNAIQTASV